MFGGEFLVIGGYLEGRARVSLFVSQRFFRNSGERVIWFLTMGLCYALGGFVRLFVGGEARFFSVIFCQNINEGHYIGINCGL